MEMNREIKFRAWDVESNEMTLPNDILEVLVSMKNEVYAMVKGRNETLGGINRDNTILMQYTGLKDNNGTEIYEGDILSTDLDRPYLIVEFRNGAFMYQCHDNGKDYYDFMATTGENSNFTKYHEVIGNIFENPELLERYRK